MRREAIRRLIRRAGIEANFHPNSALSEQGHFELLDGWVLFSKGTIWVLKNPNTSQWFDGSLCAMIKQYNTMFALMWY